MNREDIENDAEFRDFIESRDIRDKSAENYRVAIHKYCQIHQMTPTELIEEAIEEEEGGIRLSRRKIKKRLIEFREFLKEENYEARYARSVMTMIRSFYLESDINLPKIKMSNFIVRRKTEEEIPSREDINKAIKHSNIKYRAIILVMSSSGLGSNELRNLTYQDFFNGIKDHLEVPDVDPLDINKIIKLTKGKSIIIPWEIVRSKRNTPQYTFSSPEAVKATLDYLEKEPPESLDDFLFRTYGQKIMAGTFVKNFEDINDRCGFPKIGPTRYFHAHALRSYFASTALANGMKKEYVDWSIGHEMNNTDDAYYKQNKKMAYSQYKEIVEHLSITDVEKTVIKIDNPEMKKLLKQKDEEISVLKKQVANIDRKVDQKLDSSALKRMLAEDKDYYQIFSSYPSE